LGTRFGALADRSAGARVAVRATSSDRRAAAGVAQHDQRVAARGLLACLGMRKRAALIAVALGLAGCGAAQDPAGGRAGGHGAPRASGGPVAARASDRGSASAGALQLHPNVVEPVAGQVPTTPAPLGSLPVGDPNAHAPPLSVVRRELRMEMVAVRKSNASYIDPLRYVTFWGRTDQGVDADMPVGAPILAPCEVKILAIIPDWYLGQPLVYFELLAGPDAGRVQYVAEEITDIARPGSILQQGEVIARYAARGTGIEYGWSTPDGITLAVATGGYEEGQITAAGRMMRAWLNSLGANAGPNY
jgi:hypothetical protein